MGKENEKFVQVSMRHLASMRDAGPGQSKTNTPFPDNWFDLPQNVLADFGTMTYLASLNKFHQSLTLPQALAQFEPPLRLGQYKIFRSDGFPRAFITWAGLAPGAEHRFSIEHKALKPHQWNAGTSKWLIDLVAPFGHIEQILPQLAQNATDTRLRALWHNRAGTRYRVLEWTRPNLEDPIQLNSYGVHQFAHHLKGP